jgi:hypothetical protein
LLAFFACFAFVCSTWCDAVRLVPPEFVCFDVSDFSAAARLADPLITFPLDLAEPAVLGFAIPFTVDRGFAPVVSFVPGIYFDPPCARILLSHGK